MSDHTEFTEGTRTYAWRVVPDNTMGPPWLEHDGHGPVTDWVTRHKAPGEMVLSEDRGRSRFYDFAEACRIALRDGWDSPPFGQGTPRQRAARAALADFHRLRAWCNDEWHWVGVEVAPVDAHGPDWRRSVSLWGIESDADEYLAEVARDLVSEVLP